MKYCLITNFTKKNSMGETLIKERRVHRVFTPLIMISLKMTYALQSYIKFITKSTLVKFYRIIT